jgi:hypothetical protein
MSRRVGPATVWASKPTEPEALEMDAMTMLILAVAALLTLDVAATQLR